MSFLQRKLFSRNRSFGVTWCEKFNFFVQNFEILKYIKKYFMLYFLMLVFVVARLRML